MNAEQYKTRQKLYRAKRNRRCECGKPISAMNQTGMCEKCVRDGQGYEPSQEEIAAACKEFQRGWCKLEEINRRADDRDKPQHVELRELARFLHG